MKPFRYLVLVSTALIVACTTQEQNPLLSDFNTPFGVPPFDQVKEEHFLPAFKEAIRQHNKEIEAIAGNEKPATFDNTIVQMERSGKLLERVSNVFYNLNSAMTNEQMQEISKKLAPMLSKHRDDIRLNARLFERVKAIQDSRKSLVLDREQERLLDDYYKSFVRNGANLDDAKKNALRSINEELSLLSVQFGENVLKENNRFELVIEDKTDLAGLTPAIIKSAEEAANERGHEGKWVFTLHKPSLIPFLQYSEKRDLREKMFKGYINRGDHDDALDNKDILTKMAALRVKRANLLGFATHADYVLAENMAKTPQNVYDLLNKLWTPALDKAKQEVREMQAIIDAEGGGFELQPWDWWYYAEKLKKQKYDLDEKELRPYFQVENVRNGAFWVANQLFGITFTERDDIPKYHEDVHVFEVKEADGSHIGILFTDYFPRASKRGGAWMNAFRKQSNLDGNVETPIISNVGNFSKPTADQPALISLDETLTLFHEFGHALHGLLSKRHYPSLTGTSVARDFVELPSQIMENWALDPQVLKQYARHYETDEPMPAELIEKIRNSGHFNQGFMTVEYLAASFLDMDWHTLEQPEEKDAIAFENAAMDRIGLISEIVPRYRSPYFRHIFAGGYSSGYYSYIWAEVLDADAFQAFKETSLFDQKTAQAFRKNILAAGGSEDPMVLYKRFRGSEPDIEALLIRRGLK